jgi:cyclopropane fatty-acyl-phospholipid synthase-like methyltransferase
MDDYYDKNYKEYFDVTVNIDPSGFLFPLYERLKPGSKILDIGSGAGRDIKWFADRGMNVTGFELSPNLAQLSREYTGCEVIEGNFYIYDFSQHNVDALVSVGSLVHVEKENFIRILQSICRALKNKGLMLITLKEGSGTRKNDDGREFILWNNKELLDIFSQCDLRLVDFTRTVSAIRSDDVWLGYILEKNQIC